MKLVTGCRRDDEEFDMKVAVVGAGGAGGYFAGRWCEAGLDVTLIARGAHLDAMREHGLQLLSPRGDITVHPTIDNDPAALAAADVVMFATKTWQLEEAAAHAAPHLRADCVVFGVQNGVGSPEALARFVNPANVLGGTCRIISLIERPGVIRHIGVDPTILVGEVDGGLSDRVRELSDGLTFADKAAVVGSPDVVGELWKKLLLFAPVSGVGSVTESAIGVFRADPEGRRLLEHGVAEVATVARALGVVLDENVVENTLAFIDTMPPDGTTSLQRDFAANLPTELEALSGEISRRGKELGVPTPTHDLIANTLRAR
jgi:2-dehydropantoate 2-reductase